MDNKQLSHEAHRPCAKKYPLCLLLHDMEVPTNVGSLFRLADALGIEKIFLSGNTVVPPNTKIRKTSRATEKYVAFEYFTDVAQVIELLRSTNYKIISLEITDNSKKLADLEISAADKICLVIGSENYGVDQHLLALSDEVIHIPMLGINSSMNVASACSIACYEITQKMES